MRSLAEWVIALGVLAGMVRVVVPLVRQWTPLGSATVTLVESSLPSVPPGIPASAQPVPFLILLDGTSVRLGMPESALAAPPFPRLIVAPSVAVAGVFDSRLIRAFQSGSTRFWVVLDRMAPGQDREVTGIYVR